MFVDHCIVFTVMSDNAVGNLMWGERRYRVLNRCRGEIYKYGRAIHLTFKEVVVLYESPILFSELIIITRHWDRVVES